MAFEIIRRERLTPYRFYHRMTPASDAHTGLAAQARSAPA